MGLLSQLWAGGLGATGPTRLGRTGLQTSGLLDLQLPSAVYDSRQGCRTDC